MKRTYRRLFKRSKKRVIRYGLLTANLALLIAVVGFVLHNPASNQSSAQHSLLGGSNEVAASPLDQLSSADIAVHVARMTRLPEANSVTEHADTVNAQMSITAADDKVVAKPQVVNTALKSKKDIQTYVVQSGDTVTSIAAKFGITSDSVRWSNGLVGDVVSAGKQLTIPPISGIVYEVKSGDTPEKLASRFNANKDQIIVFNDAEVGGLKVGEKIVIPDGIQPVQRTFNANNYGGGFAWGGFAPIYGGNGYDYGYCTWWVAVRRAQVGKPIPSNLGNASTWKVLAQRAGMAVGTEPAQYAVIWTPPRDYYGHVGFVESVDADGTVHISEMNTVGWGRVSYRTLTPAQAAGYSYIY
jgi:surface antigen/LysM repeat protein